MRQYLVPKRRALTPSSSYLLSALNGGEEERVYVIGSKDRGKETTRKSKT
jgi:hypothetical protein